MQWLCVPFSMMNPAVSDITETAYNNTYQPPWIGTLEADRAWRWIDNFLLLVRADGFLSPSLLRACQVTGVAWGEFMYLLGISDSSISLASCVHLLHLI